MITAGFRGGRSYSSSQIPHQPLSDSRRLTIEGASGLCFPEPGVSGLIMRSGPGGGWRRERSACEGVRHEVCQVDLVSRP